MNMKGKQNEMSHKPLYQASTPRQVPGRQPRARLALLAVLLAAITLAGRLLGPGGAQPGAVSQAAQPPAPFASSTRNGLDELLAQPTAPFAQPTATAPEPSGLQP
jgi:hypothetical protein